MKRLFFILFLFPCFCFGQITFQKLYDTTPLGGVGYAVTPTSDGGYIMAGVYSVASGNADFYVIKTNNVGNVTWTRGYGGSDNDIANSIKQTYDGGYIISGVTQSFGLPYLHMYLVKIDSIGDLEWSKAFGDSVQTFSNEVQQTVDSGYVVCGYTAEDLSYDFDVLLVRTNSNGDTLWTRKFDSDSADATTSVIETNDGGFAITGQTGQTLAVGDGFLIKTDINGDLEWDKIYSDNSLGSPRAIHQTTDTGFVLTGWQPCYLLKTDPIGGAQWAKTFEYDRGNSVEQTFDGGYIIAGSTSLNAQNTWDGLLIKTDDLGDTLWTRTYGPYDSQYASEGIQTADSGFLFTGVAFDTTAVGRVYTVKTDAEGNSGCYEYNLGTITNTTNPVESSGFSSRAGCKVFTTATQPSVPPSTYQTLCYPIGLDEHERNNQFTIYPNPTTGLFTVQGTVAVLQVYDLFGRLVLRLPTGQAGTKEQQVDMSSYPKGIYMVRAGEAVRKVVLH